MEPWLPSLITDTPEEGYDLAVTLARKVVGKIKPDTEIKKKLRPINSKNAESLIIGNSLK